MPRVTGSPSVIGRRAPPRWATRLDALVLALALCASPLLAEPQQPPAKSARVGYLSFRSGATPLDEVFRQGLRVLGYVEGQNIAIEYRYAAFKPDRAAALAAELVRLNLDVIVSVGGAVSATAAKNATTTIPIVFESGDPVGLGLVTKLDRPAGNLTGVNNFTLELNAKRLELLKEALPGVSRVFVLANPASPAHARRLKELEGAARLLRVKLTLLEARQPQDIDVAFAALARERGDAFLLMTSPLFFQRDRIVNLVTKHRLPGMFFSQDYAEAGGLLSYSPSFTDTYRRLATYVDKILKGARPRDIPVEEPTTFELVVNLKTAKALGLTVPQSILLRANRVIE